MKSPHANKSAHQAMLTLSQSHTTPHHASPHHTIPDLATCKILLLITRPTPNIPPTPLRRTKVINLDPNAFSNPLEFRASRRGSVALLGVIAATAAALAGTVVLVVRGGSGGCGVVGAEGGVEGALLRSWEEIFSDV